MLSSFGIMSCGSGRDKDAKHNPFHFNRGKSKKNTVTITAINQRSFENSSIHIGNYRIWVAPGELRPGRTIS